jgi:hypothetical protein
MRRTALAAILFSASLQASTADVVSNVGGSTYTPSYTPMFGQYGQPLHKEADSFSPVYILAGEYVQIWHDTPYYAPVVIPEPELLPEQLKPYVPDWTPLQPVTCPDPAMPCLPPPRCIEGCSWWQYDPPSIVPEPDDPSSAVPEPGTWSLMVAGAGVLVIRRRK